MNTADTPNDAAPEAGQNISADGFDYGPHRTYEITWSTGYVERIKGHQLTVPGPRLFGGLGETRWMIHGYFAPRWTCVLVADEGLIAMVRDVTDGERFGDVSI